MLTLSVLDQSPIRRGGTAAEAVAETLALAELADRLGYRRYWVAEHHSSGGLAGASPEILIGAVAAHTRHIRVGSGGVMLNHYSPLKVAEQFRMLETLYPGRIDLGVGRAPGSDGRTARALMQGGQGNGFTVDDYPERLVDLTGYLTNDLPPTHPFHGVRAMPDGPSAPELWLLGSTTAGASYAAHFGWAFSFAQFISPEGGEDIVRAYRRAFRPSPLLAEPRASLGVSVTCAETDEEAERLSWSRWCWRVMAQYADRRGIPSPEEALAYPYTPAERQYIEHMRDRSIFGSPATVRAKLHALAERYDVDELVAVTITYDPVARRRSYELLAEAFELRPPPPALPPPSGRGEPAVGGVPA
jgi:luciferase family oxidoreductase group 1